MNVDAKWAIATTALFKDRLLEREELLEGPLREPDAVEEMAGDGAHAAAFAYASGLPLADVRRCLLVGARGFRRACELRDAFKAGAVQLCHWSGAPWTPQFSMTNSRQEVEAFCAAHVGLAPDLARSIALAFHEDLTWRWVFHGSEVSDPADHHTALALQAWAGGDTKGARSVLRRARTADELKFRQRQMIDGVLLGSTGTFQAALSEYMALFEQRRRKQPKESKYFLAINALGIASWGVAAGVLERSGLSECPAFPLGLVGGAEK